MNWEKFSAEKNVDDIRVHKEFIGGMLRIGVPPGDSGSSGLSIVGDLNPEERAYKRARMLAEDPDVATMGQPLGRQATFAAASPADGAEAERLRQERIRREEARLLLNLSRNNTPASVNFAGKRMRVF